MQIVRIFADVESNPPWGLFSVCMEPAENNQHEFEILTTQLQDMVYLKSYFDKHKEKLQHGYYSGVSIDEAIRRTVKETQYFEERIMKLHKEGLQHLCTWLNEIFKPLAAKDRVYSTFTIERSKARGYCHNSWLRVYAIRIAPNFFIITGGGIKLVERMQDDILLKKELKKINRVRDFLKEEELYDADDFTKLKF